MVLNITVSNTEFLLGTFSVSLGVIGGFSFKNILLCKCRIEIYTVKEADIESGVPSKDSVVRCEEDPLKNVLEAGGGFRRGTYRNLLAFLCFCKFSGRWFSLAVGCFLCFLLTQ